jgi:plastocyanin
MGFGTVGRSILVMGISLVIVVILWAWIGHIGPTYSADTLTQQQASLRKVYGLPPKPIISDPKILQTPPSLRNIAANSANAANATNATKASTTNVTKASVGTTLVGGTAVSIVPAASTLASKAFSPSPVTVKVKNSVTWTNKDNVAHTITSGTGPSDPNKGKEFDSGLSSLLTPGKTFTHTFKTSGEIPYFCQIHPTMVGKVTIS